ncbi:HTH-type transcriptional regulator BetI [Ascidiaceihabitans donghaensis]|uniref:HTH-type transcriptional regulator BetI n=1 Tax=Ascidiaceihabitans donghaensis TaxID=1510460 RepID=A0A2R8BDP3_9RHOB|nr:TetR/AcrR family transcriptional regulator [Ascidiaceihabitans donghaensis]SPH21069.1 HTH-type transcriptional regulator BetI [Ascidiaceihabitans donghaensis]
MSDTPIEVRKRPVQARSKARVEAILDAARDIISEIGSDGMKMSVLAHRAGVPIGTVYQFFPNKSAVIYTLVTDIMQQMHTALQAQMEGIQSLDDASGRIDQMVRGYYQFLKDEPVMRDILGSTQGDKKLQALDQEDSRTNGAMMFEHMKPFVSQQDHKRLKVVLFLNAHLTGSLTRLAVTEDAEMAETLLQIFVKRLQDDLLSFKQV